MLALQGRFRHQSLLYPLDRNGFLLCHSSLDIGFFKQRAGATMVARSSIVGEYDARDRAMARWGIPSDRRTCEGCCNTLSIMFHQYLEALHTRFIAVLRASRRCIVFEQAIRFAMTSIHCIF
jgi:hypothetical protein